MPASSPPAPPSKWPVMDLVELTAKLGGVRAEDLLDGQGFQPVVVEGGGAVGVDVVHLLGPDVGVRQSVLHDTRRRRWHPPPAG